MLRMDWKDTKSDNPMMIIDFKRQNGSKGRAMFPQVNDFFVAEAKQACEVLLGLDGTGGRMKGQDQQKRQLGVAFCPVFRCYHNKQESPRTPIVWRPEGN